MPWSNGCPHLITWEPFSLSPDSQPKVWRGLTKPDRLTQGKKLNLQTWPSPSLYLVQDTLPSWPNNACVVRINHAACLTRADKEK